MAQKRFQEDFCGNRIDADGVRTQAKMENPDDPNWSKEPFLNNVIVCVADNDFTFIHHLIDKCRLSAKRGKTVILALGTPPGSSSLDSYRKAHPKDGCPFYFLLDIAASALPYGTPMGWKSSPSDLLSFDPISQCLDQPRTSHPDFPPRNTFPASPFPTRFILFHSDPAKVQWNLTHSDLAYLAWGLLGSLAASPPQKSPTTLRPNRPPTPENPHPPSFPTPLLYSSLGPCPGDENPRHHPLGPLLSVAWYKRMGMIPHNCTLATFLPGDQECCSRYAVALHSLATVGIKGLHHFTYLPPGVLPQKLLPFLRSGAGVSTDSLPGITAALAATSIRGYYRAEAYKQTVTARLLTDMGLPSPPFDHRPPDITSPCEKCDNFATCLWIIRSKRITTHTIPPPCATLITAIADTYTISNNKRIGPGRGPLTTELRHRILQTLCRNGVAVCWLCALPTLISRLRSSTPHDISLCPPLPPPLPHHTTTGPPPLPPPLHPCCHRRPPRSYIHP